MLILIDGISVAQMERDVAQSYTACQPLPSVLISFLMTCHKLNSYERREPQENASIIYGCI